MTNSKIVGFNGDKKDNDQITCPSCVHYFDKGIDPNTLERRGGDCRYNPPTVGFLGGQTAAGIQVMPVTGYPVVRYKNPICSKFKARVDT